MVNASVVAGYLTMWLVLRLAALRLAKPARARSGSPWLTRLVLVYCFVFSVGFVAATSWSVGNNVAVDSTRLGLGIFVVAVALMTDAMCLHSLRPFYSLEIELKPGHTVTRSGLYRVVRHPIYLSNMFGFLGLCILMNHWAAWLALPAQVVGFFLMARREEYFLVRHLGKVYVRYRADVRWMLIPGVL